MLDEKKKTQTKIFIYWTLAIISISSIIITIYATTEKFDKQYVSSSTMSGKKIKQVMFGSDCEQVSENVKNEISKIEEIISYEIYGSDIEKINKSQGKWVKVNKLTIETLEKVINISKHTLGAFDPTYLNLLDLYKNSNNFSSDSLTQQLNNTNYNFIEIDNEYNRVRVRNKDTRITLNDIFDGIACSKAIEIYKNSKIDKAIVQVGNTTGYFNYTDENSQYLKDGFLCTLDENETIINPKTGKLSKENLPFSFFYPDGITACILARACAVLNKNDAKKISNFFV